jgi:hypothetical protein
MSNQSTDEIIVHALKFNLTHARHVERQLLQGLAIYVAIALGLGYAAIYATTPAVRILASELGFCLTLAFWGMAFKLSAAFARQISHAARCAELLVIDMHSSERDLFDLIGFPRSASASPLGKITVRLMIHLIYAVFALNWLLFLGYSVLRLAIPEASL